MLKLFLGKLKTLLFGLFVIVVLFLPPIVIEKPWFGDQHPWQQVLIVCALSMVLLLWGFHLAQKEGFLIWSKDLWSLKRLRLIVLAYALIWCCDRLGLYWLEQAGQTTTANEAMLEQDFFSQPVVTNFLFIGVLGPLAEELVVRGYWMKKLFGPYERLGLIISSLVFAFLHGPSDLPSWFIYTSSGLIFGGLYLKTKNLAYPIALHMLNNLLVTIMAYLG